MMAFLDCTPAELRERLREVLAALLPGNLHGANRFLDRLVDATVAVIPTVDRPGDRRLEPPPNTLITEWPGQAIDVDNTVVRDGESSAWIQWKGTEVCADVRCRCGALSHVDVGFFYFVRCKRCDQTYCVGQRVRLYPCDPTLARDATMADPDVRFKVAVADPDDDGMPQEVT